MKTLLSFGHGYSAQALERLLDGWEVIGTHRNSPLRWPGTDMRPYLDKATHLLISAAPGPDGDPVLGELADEIAKQEFEWVGYLSTTGVYGDRGGDWVTEEDALRPATKRGIARMKAEASWTDLGLPLHIFRLAGIYGPGRGPFAKVRAGTARRIIKKGQIFSRIHVEDIAQVLKASIDRPNPVSIYNVCDNDPQPPEVVIEEAARLLGLPIPEAVDIEIAEMTPMARSFYAESKRVDNSKIRKELGVKLKHPDYKSGLRAVLSAESP